MSNIEKVPNPPLTIVLVLYFISAAVIWVDMILGGKFELVEHNKPWYPFYFFAIVLFWGMIGQWRRAKKNANWTHANKAALYLYSIVFVTIATMLWYLFYAISHMSFGF